ncbi:uncharacterized protein LOC117609618 isoform X1 [Osmia lignaria lignaria]|uniref:uncharacterized protein LOC117609618 isoform X1 n=1 Tax=Osmia lignaria lignaria TaxID=1437193 RepID=UPI00402B9D2C
MDMEKHDDAPKDVKRAAPVEREINKGQKDDTFEGYPQVVEKKKKWEHCDKPPSKKSKHSAKSDRDCCQQRKEKRQKAAKYIMISVPEKPCVLPKLDIVPRHCLTKQKYIDMLATPSRKCPPECYSKPVLRKLKPVSPRIKELAQPTRQRMLMALQQGAATLPPAFLDNLVRTLENETCLTPEQAAVASRKKKHQKKAKGRKSKRLFKETRKSRKLTIGVTSTGSTFDKDPVSCQYLIAERFVRSILKWKCPIPKAEFNDISKVIIQRLIDTLEYTPPQDEDRKSQQLRFLADAIACWVTGVLSEVAENQEKKLIERCRKKEEEMKGDEDEDDDDDDRGDEDKGKDQLEEDEDEEDEEDEDLTDRSGKSEDREREKSREEVVEEMEEMEEEIEDESGAEVIDETDIRETEGEEQAETQVEEQDLGIQTESKVEEGTEPQAEVTAEAETEAEGPATADAAVEVDTIAKEETDKEQQLTAELVPEPEPEPETEVITEPPEEAEVKPEIELTTKPSEELPVEPIVEETEEQPAESEEPVPEVGETEEITDEGAIPTEELDASVPTEEEEKEKEEVEALETEEGGEPLETEEGKKEESITALETKAPSEMGLPKDVMKDLVELFKTDLPFLTFGKIIDTINKMIAETPENTGEDPITNGIHRAIYEKLRNIVMLENPELLTEELENVMNVVCGKIANWLRSILSKSQLAFMKQFVPEVESKEIRDWTKWLSYISDVAKDWNGWLRDVIDKMFEMESAPITRGEWRDWTKSVDTKALLWRRFHLQIRHQAHRNVTMISGRHVVKTGTKKPISADQSEQLFATDLHI